MSKFDGVNAVRLGGDHPAVDRQRRLVIDGAELDPRRLRLPRVRHGDAARVHRLVHVGEALLVPAAAGHRDRGRRPARRREGPRPGSGRPRRPRRYRPPHRQHRRPPRPPSRPARPGPARGSPGSGRLSGHGGDQPLQAAAGNQPRRRAFERCMPTSCDSSDSLATLVQGTRPHAPILEPISKTAGVADHPEEWLRPGYVGMN